MEKFSEFRRNVVRFAHLTSVSHFSGITTRSRRNGELLPSIKSRFLREIAGANLEEKKTLRVTSMGRSTGGREGGFSGAYPARRTYDVPSWRRQPAFSSPVGSM